MRKLAFPVFVVAASATTMPLQAQPLAGLWELTVTVEGAPSGGGSRTQQACLVADRLKRAPERSFFDASRLQGERSPTCEWGEVQRASDGSARWQASCESPVGAAKGPGEAVVSSDRARLSQQLKLDTPWGARTLSQRIDARRIGACP